LVSKNRFILGNLTLTNYDHDHYSGLPYLIIKVHIDTIQFSRNLTADEIFDQKPVKTGALDAVCDLKRRYTNDAVNHNPPYTKVSFHLNKSDFGNQEINTNNLSQIVFVKYKEAVICISGDLEQTGWDIMLEKENVKDWLKQTGILIAAHHGRENGYAEEIFGYCRPECVIISDKKIIHGTQVGMSQAYSQHVVGDGIILNEDMNRKRKVLTTRNDGHLWIRITDNGSRIYRSFNT